MSLVQEMRNLSLPNPSNNQQTNFLSQWPENRLVTYTYELTSIQDVNGIMIRYEYDRLGGSDNAEESKDKLEEAQLFGEAYKSWDDEQTDMVRRRSVFNAPTRMLINPLIRHRNRLRRIIDTWGNVVVLNYIVNSGDSDENRFRVGDIAYRNQNGEEKKIRYYYDITHYLTAVRVDGLPNERYEYSDYNAAFKQYVVGHRSGWDGHFYSDEVYYDYPGHDQPGENHTIGDALTGKILTRVTSREGSQVTYRYEDCLVKGDTITQDGVRFQTLYEELSAPCVVEKRLVEAEGKEWVYRFSYPRNGAGNLMKSPYPVLNETKSSF